MEGITLRFLGKGDERLNLGKLKGNEFEITVRNIEKKPRPIRKFRNLFDSQRFGKNMDNHVIGKAIIMKDFRKACEMIDDGKIKTHLASRPNDYVGALKTLPKKVLQLYVHAYQSFLWNGMAAGSFEESLPLIGFYTDETDEVKRVLEREGIRREDFIIRQMPELSAEGGERAVFAEVGRLQVRELEDDELNPGEKKVRVSFRLGKGSYATQVVREMFA
jgi:tRNA pseudouridine13 synthase